MEKQMENGDGRKKINLGKHSVSYGEPTKNILGKAKGYIGQMVIKLVIFYFVYLQLLTLWGRDATFLLLFFFISYNIADGATELKKIREALQKLNETEKKPEWKE